MESPTKSTGLRGFVSLCISLLWIQARIQPISTNPIQFNPSPISLIAIPPPRPVHPLASTNGPLMFGPQFDAGYSPLAHGQYLYASPAAFNGAMPLDASRRSLVGSALFGGRSSDKASNNKSPEDSDEQKALSDIPLSFIEPDGPSSFTERISDSFSALGEGVRNHFRSMSENFSDTLEDIRDAWRPSQHSRKRFGR